MFIPSFSLVLYRFRLDANIPVGGIPSCVPGKLFLSETRNRLSKCDLNVFQTVS